MGIRYRLEKRTIGHLFARAASPPIYPCSICLSFSETKFLFIDWCFPKMRHFVPHSPRFSHTIGDLRNRRSGRPEVVRGPPEGTFFPREVVSRWPEGTFCHPEGLFLCPEATFSPAEGTFFLSEGAPHSPEVVIRPTEGVRDAREAARIDSQVTPDASEITRDDCQVLRDDFRFPRDEPRVGDSRQEGTTRRRKRGTSRSAAHPSSVPGNRSRTHRVRMIGGLGGPPN